MFDKLKIHIEISKANTTKNSESFGQKVNREKQVLENINSKAWKGRAEEQLMRGTNRK